MSNLLIIFLTIFTHSFTIITVTNKNQHCEFDVREVDCIGRIRIDDLFMDYVSDFMGTYTAFGVTLQTIILDYIKEKYDLAESCSGSMIIKDLINEIPNSQSDFIEINKLDVYLQNITGITNIDF